VLIFAPDARAHTVDRVAAIVGDQVVLLGEVREAAAPELAAIHETDALARARAEAKALHDACERIIDVILIEAEAARLKIEVTPDEVERAIGAIAKEHSMTEAAVMRTAADQGYDEARYRAFLRVELLRGKILQLRRPDPAKLDEASASLSSELRDRTYVEDRLAP